MYELERLDFLRVKDIVGSYIVRRGRSEVEKKDSET
jgi:hypothetical protein